MTTDQVDVTIGCLLNHEVPQMEEEGLKSATLQWKTAASRLFMNLSLFPMMK